MLNRSEAEVKACADHHSKVYGQANPVLTISYTGFVNGENVSAITAPTVSTTAATSSAPGSYPITLSGGSAANYNLTLQNGTMTIGKVPLTAKADDQSKVYGQVNPALTITYTGFVNGDNASSVTSPTASTTATASSGAGTYPITLSGGSAANYTITLQGGTLTITKTDLTAKADNQSKVYGQANPALTISYTGFVNGENTSSIIPPTASTTAIATSGVGSYPITLSGGSAAHYSLTLVAGTLTISKATPSVTWVNPSAITFGTPLSATQLNATASVAGAFTYSPAAATVLNAGANQTLSANFTPSDGAKNNEVNGTTVLITVNKVTTVVTWTNPAAITYLTALSWTQLNATANVPGQFSYAPGSGTILNAGANQALSVNFTPGDAVNYNVVNGTQVLISVNKGTPVITWANPAAINYSTALSATQLNATASVPGTFAYTPAGGTALNAGANQVLSVNFSPTDAANYNAVNGT